MFFLYQVNCILNVHMCLLDFRLFTFQEAFSGVILYGKSCCHTQ